MAHKAIRDHVRSLRSLRSGTRSALGVGWILLGLSLGLIASPHAVSNCADALSADGFESLGSLPGGFVADAFESARPLGLFVPPSDARVVDVTSARFGARGDGLTDDTAALQAALCGSAGNSINKLVYLPPGTYLVSDTLRWCIGFKRYLTLRGASSDQVVLRLRADSPGFSDPESPKPILSMVGDDVPGQPVNARAYSFRNSVIGLTIEVEGGNAGADAIAFLGSNSSDIQDVQIRAADGSGRVALNHETPIQGPTLIKGVSVEGFAHALSARYDSFNLVVEHLKTRHQRRSAIRSEGMRLSIRNWLSINAVPAYEGLSKLDDLVLLQASLFGGAPCVPALRAHGMVHVRALRSEGYARALEHPEWPVDGTRIVHYTSHGGLRGDGASAGEADVLALPIAETPVLDEEPPERWVSVTDFGAVPNQSPYNGRLIESDDDTRAIQAAIDSGAETVYFPSGQYAVRGTLRLRGRLKRLIGMESVLKLGPPLTDSTDNAALFLLEEGSTPAVRVERFDNDFVNDGAGRCTAFRRNSTRTWVLKDMMMSFCAVGYDNLQPGETFVENVSAGNWRFTGGHTWIRQLNPEDRSADGVGEALEGAARKLTLRGGAVVWLLGLKTEGTGIIADVSEASRLEILGGALLATDFVPSTHPAFLVRDSALSVVGSDNADPFAAYRTLLDRQTSDVLERLSNSAMPGRGAGSRILIGDAARAIERVPPRSTAERWLEAEDVPGVASGLQDAPRRWGYPAFFGQRDALGPLPEFPEGFVQLPRRGWLHLQQVELPAGARFVDVSYGTSLSAEQAPTLSLRITSPDGLAIVETRLAATPRFANPYVPGRTHPRLRVVSMPLTLPLPPGRHELYLRIDHPSQTGLIVDIDRVRLRAGESP